MGKGFQEANLDERYQEAIRLIAAGHLSQGLKVLKQVIKQLPSWIEPRLLATEALINMGDLAAARRSLSHLLDRSTNDQRIQFLQGRIEEEDGNLSDAERIYLDLLNQVPSFDNAAGQIAKVYILQEKWQDAEAWISRGLQTRPRGLDLIANLSVVLLRQNKLEEARAISEQALILGPENADILVNHGTILQELGLRDEAKTCYEKALLYKEENLTAISNLGVLYFQNGNFVRAEEYYRRAIATNPSDIRTKVNLAGLLLLTGRSTEGWSLYESRLEGQSYIMDAPENICLWDGKPSTKKLLVVHEQGLGDTFQFIRYAKALRQICNKLEFSGPQKLHPILLDSDIVYACHTNTPPQPEHYAGWIPLMSMAALANDEKWEVDHQAAYLVANTENINRWEELLGAKTGLRIGLHWQGNPAHEFTISRGRSFPLESLAPLADLEDAELISLQKGPGSEQLQQCSFREKFHKAQDKINAAWDFTDVAAILECCDLVISSDSGLAHLAGALGRPVWLLLPHIPEWRWGLAGSYTHWYPNHHLFRQAEEGNWQHPVQLIVEQLRPDSGKLNGG